MQKPRILLVTDSAHLDTGFGRVAREIGTRIVKSGRFHLTQLGWFHLPSDRVVPFRVIPTSDAGRSEPGPDDYAQLSYDRVVAQVKPDIVLAIGDEWMIKHIAARPRQHRLIGYVPIDSMPIKREWIKTLRMLDLLVVYGDFGEAAVQMLDPQLQMYKIPHGVNAALFRPLPQLVRTAVRRQLFGNPDFFIVGCVARNNTRKMLPRLLEAFRKFISGSTTCQVCGHVEYKLTPVCLHCGNRSVDRLAFSKPKDDARLYMHCVPDDPAGNDLLSLIQRHNLNGKVAFPVGMSVGRGVSDCRLAEIYNAMDVFTLPTGGEGWGLPLLEAMACGVPTLATHYSAHVDFMRDGAGEFIAIAEMFTEGGQNLERALVDIDDYVLKLDRYYYDQERFKTKWGPRLLDGGYDQAQVDALTTGKEFRELGGRLANERAQQYSWDDVATQWMELFDAVVDRSEAGEQSPSTPVVEVFS